MSTLIVAMGGGAGIREFLSYHQLPLPPPALTQDQAEELLKRDLERERSDSEWRRLMASYLWQVYDAQVERAKIRDAVICKMNRGKPFARSVDCEAVWDWDSVPLGMEFEGPFKAQFEYPKIPKPPVPRPQ